jgi:hypothetical protein
MRLMRLYKEREVYLMLPDCSRRESYPVDEAVERKETLPEVDGTIQEKRVIPEVDEDVGKMNYGYP